VLSKGKAEIPRQRQRPPAQERVPLENFQILPGSTEAFMPMAQVDNQTAVEAMITSTGLGKQEKPRLRGLWTRRPLKLMKTTLSKSCELVTSAHWPGRTSHQYR
jgi:hypothetical protein